MELLKAKDHIETDIDVDFVRGSFNDEFSIRLSQFTTRIQRNLSIINAMHHYKLSKNVEYGVGNVFKINQKSIIDSLGFDVFSLDVPFKYDIYFATGRFLGIRIFKKDRLENSVKKRNNLLSNENYIKKAPANLVETEKLTLEKEIQELEIITNKLKEINV